MRLQTVLFSLLGLGLASVAVAGLTGRDARRLASDVKLIWAVASNALVKGVTELLGSGEGQTVTLPITIGGTVTAPTFSIDYDALAKQAKKK